MPKHNFVIFGSSWDLYKLAYADVNNYENIKYITYPTNLIGKGFYFYQKIENHLRLQVHNVFFHSFFKNDFKKQLPIVFLYFRGWVEHKIQTQMVNYYRKKYPDSKHILFLQDLVTTDKWNYPIYDAKDNYDIVLSFDPGDCQKYQLIYHPLVFSKYSSHNLSIKYDITFIGQGKNRLEEL
ncbi:MAG: hypothetical protein IKB95_08415, partial [Bacteroidales bacterium]|nr:hypothetical protein [Bacteroidales bacterium]